ncbi:MAG: hypothetical protein ABI569_04510 [Casimicrobiaceae bacterium]
MMIQASYRNHVSYAVEREVSRQLNGDTSGDFPDCGFDDADAEICRMIELSGMVGLECDILQGD